MNARILSLLERAMELSPVVSRRLAGGLLCLASPFNAPLRASVRAFKPTFCRIRVPNRRALHNHLRGVHACALATAGETAAGLMLLRSFPMSRFRLILKDLSVSYERQARTALVAEASLEEALLDRVRAGLAGGEAQLVPVETRIREPSGKPLAVVRTTWQVKAWDRVRSPA